MAKAKLGKTTPLDDVLYWSGEVKSYEESLAEATVQLEDALAFANSIDGGSYSVSELARAAELRRERAHYMILRSRSRVGV